MATITLKKHSGRIAPETQKTRRGKSSQSEQGNNRDVKKREQRNRYDDGR
jgi:hypothetical protein